MAKRNNHYDVAFEAYLRHYRIPYVAVDETRRSLASRGSLKSLDFIVSPSVNLSRCLVDVKGRRFPSGTGRTYWKNWTTADELRSLGQWESLLGDQFRATLVFAYWVTTEVSPLPPEELWSHGGRWYAFLAVGLNDYLSHARVISPKWETLALSASQFRAMAIPASQLLGCMSENRLRRSPA